MDPGFSAVSLSYCLDKNISIGKVEIWHCARHNNKDKSVVQSLSNVRICGSSTSMSQW